jgi:hypothetical protein
MSAIASRHGLAFVLAIAVSLLLFTLGPAPAAAASAAGLYSISGSQHLIRIDPVSGAETSIADLSVPGLPFGFETMLGNIAADQTNQQLFVDRTIVEFDVDPQVTVESRFLTITPSTGAVTVGPTIAQQLGSYAFDPTSGNVVGVTECCTREIVRVDLASGAETNVASVTGDQFSTETIDPASHMLYVASSSFTTFPPATQILSVNLLTNVVSSSPVLGTGLVGLAFDTSSQTLFGASFILCCPLDWSLFRVDPSTGAEVPITDIPNAQIIGSSLALDTSTHTAYVVNSALDATGGQFTYIVAINDQTGTYTQGQAVPELFLGTLAFLSTAVTADAVETQIQNALASGGIDNAGVASSLLAEIKAAAAAGGAGNCTTAAKIYSAFINDVSAQSGKHVAAATASELVGEAQVLMASCP